MDFASPECRCVMGVAAPHVVHGSEVAFASTGSGEGPVQFPTQQQRLLGLFTPPSIAFAELA